MCFYLNFFLDISQIREVKRFVAPTLKEIRKRKKAQPEALTHRSTFIEWNYPAEIYAFSKRLNEELNPAILQQAFTHRSYVIQEEMKQREVGIENPNLNLPDNSKLVEKGEKIINEYINAFLSLSLNKVPREGIRDICNYLMSEENLAHISSNLGTTDLILSGDFPVEKCTLASTFKAIVGAISESSGDAKAFDFVRDFVCTQLNQKDVFDLWNIEKPIELLQKICSEEKLAPPEPRLIADSAKNTIFASYHVGVYSNKKMMGSGFGETIDVAIEEACKDAIRQFTGTQSNMKPFNFKIKSEEIMIYLNEPSIAKLN